MLGLPVFVSAISLPPSIYEGDNFVPICDNPYNKV